MLYFITAAALALTSAFGPVTTATQTAESDDIRAVISEVSSPVTNWGRSLCNVLPITC